MDVCGIVLAGGKSTRMGTNKSLLKINNKRVIELVVEELKLCSEEVILISNDESAVYDFLNLRQFSDRYIDKGPLAGIETAMHHVQAELFIIAACDMPFVNQQIYAYLLGEIEDYDAVIPKFAGRTHPLSGIYRKSVLPHVQKQLKNNNLRMMSFFEDVNVKYVEDFNEISDENLQKHFFNMNNPQQYEQAKSY